jgi:hypothetical protein
VLTVGELTLLTALLRKFIITVNSCVETAAKSWMINKLSEIVKQRRKQLGRDQDED